MISVIIRTKNEERWIKPCLEGVLKQEVDQPIEVVLVDNASTDKTVDRARAVCPDLRLVKLDEFRPGHALNEGIRAASGEYLVCLSAHCPPVNEHWLDALLRNVQDPSVAGVYGRQVPTRFTKPVDKRDLLLIFGLERRVQERDSFFHNANSMIRREIWDLFPFNEEISNIEDRLWGKDVIEAGLRIVYEPEAMVFHHHGIHQDNRPDRARNVVRVMEDHLPEVHPDRFGNPFDPTKLEVAALISLRSAGSNVDSNRQLIARTVKAAQNSTYIDRVLVTTDSAELAEIAVSFGADVPFIRAPELAAEAVRVDEVLRTFLGQLEAQGYVPDIVVPMEVLYPFRPDGLLDAVIEELVREGFDSVVAGFAEYRPCWRTLDGGYECITTTEQPRDVREPIYVGVPSLACATYPSNLRLGNRMAGKLGVYKISSPLAGIEVRTLEQLRAIEVLLQAGAQTVSVFPE